MISEFLTYQAQTTPHPLLLEVKKARGSYVYDTDDKAYLDFIAGVSALTLGHCHPAVNKAIKDQIEQYAHVMVYGEFVQKPTLDLAKELIALTPPSIESVYFTNSGTEATEGALKLAKRATNRIEIIAFKNSYHGNTQGSMSVSGAEQQNRAFRPLLPGIKFIEFNNETMLDQITSKTAGVIVETIQGGAGFIVPEHDFLHKLQKRCNEVGALLIVDEIQTGIGRLGTFFGFESFNCIPDIIITGKGLGGGMPIGAFLSSKSIMSTLQHSPKLGHITTFGGHPVIAASALATVNTLLSSNLMEQIAEKEALFKTLLKHPEIKEIRGKGLMLALILKDAESASKIIHKSLEKGLLLFWLLFEPRAVRISPPLTITLEEIERGCKIILEAIDS